MGASQSLALEDHQTNIDIDARKDVKGIITFGYIRMYIEEDEEFNGSLIIPTSIKSVCTQFYGFFRFIKSTIVTVEETKILEQLLYNHNKIKYIQTYIEWKLLYKASKDGFSVNAFNQAVKNHKNLFVIIHTTGNNIFGGYTKKGFPKYNGSNNTDPNAFVFLLRSQRSNNYQPGIFDIRYRSRAILTSNQYMCCFGRDGRSIKIYTSGKGTVDGMRDFKEKSYRIPSQYYLNGGYKNFQAADIEVFQCE